MPKKKYIFLLVLVFVLAAVIVYILKPYRGIEEVRTSNQLKEISAVFVNFTGDASCAKLYRYTGSDIASTTSPVFLALPEGMQSPDEGLTAYSNNVFNLTGYEYHILISNVFTGSTVSQISNRFDVTSWEVVTPYKIWTDRIDKDGMLLIESKNDPVGYSFGDDTNTPNKFSKGNYTDCSK
ncbi:MAG: hypothetical protein GY806_05705 [Gammaproteobacteria bacterium]|nr:hypothetical protein [Gammaproteobacteria bacterium]